MRTVDKLRARARELAGEAWDHDRSCLPAQAYVRREGSDEKGGQDPTGRCHLR